MHDKSLEHEMEKGKPVFRHCEEPTGPREARGPMTGSATKQSNSTAPSWIASLRSQ
jgi:hypothetical protein